MLTSFQNDEINFALYSCNWTEMSIKFKKLLLLTMHINNANNFKLNVSTNIIVNLQLYTSVCTLYIYTLQLKLFSIHYYINLWYYFIFSGYSYYLQNTISCTIIVKLVQMNLRIKIILMK